MISAQVKVRLQARGGKILGPAVQQPLLTVKNLTRNVTPIVDAKFDQRSSGKVVPAYAKGVSRNAIVVEEPAILGYPTPGPYWLEMPGGGEGELIVSLDLDEPTQLEFRATAYAPYPVYSSATMWVLPGMQLLDDPGLVITVAGLFTEVSASAAGPTVTVTAKVTMMCGCPITDASKPPPSGVEPYWPSPEFDVTAQVRPQGSSGPWQPVSMACTGTSAYTGSTNLSPGTYDVWLLAVQAKETNVGFAKTTVKVG